MRILACGGRDFCDLKYIYRTLDIASTGSTDVVLIHGDQRGADKIAHTWAIRRNFMPLPYPADWTRLGKSAGPIRNQRMLDEQKPDFVIAFPGNEGTANMVILARKAGVLVVVTPYPYFIKPMDLDLVQPETRRLCDDD